MIKDRFKELYIEWFENKHFWFDKKIENDIYLSQKYFLLIKDVKHINDLDIDIKDIETQIGAILALDQIPRHYNRVLDNDVDKVDCFVYSKIASELSLNLMDFLMINQKTYNNIKAYEWCFILLPFRHINDIEKLNTITTFIIEKHNNENTSTYDKNIYKKYLLQTLNKIYKINNKNCIEKQKDINKTSVNDYDQWNKYKGVIQYIPDDPIIFGKDNDIGINIDISGVKDENIIVSLSGGVDSCVCLFILHQLFPYNNIVAVHINYNNRPDDNAIELKFVKKICAILNIKLFHRTIYEIQRDSCHLHGLRDLYENITKDIRFDMYRSVSELFQNNCKTLVVLGHNMDDCFENIITNIGNKSNYSNLSGVNIMSTISDINFWRPFLNTRKKDIIDYAVYHNIPYLKNSTPTWSARGKVRDVVLPALESVNPDMMNAFFVLKEYLISYHELVDKHVIKGILDKFSYHYVNKNKYIKAKIDKESLICMFSIWKQIFESSLFIPLIGSSKISAKSISEYVKCLERFKDNQKTRIKYILRHDLYVLLKKTGNQMISIELCKQFINEN